MTAPLELLPRQYLDGTCGRIIGLLEEGGARYRLVPHAPEGRTEVASRLRGHPPAQAAKCIVARVRLSKRSGRYVLAVVPGDRLVDLDELARLYGGRDAAFADRETAARLSGATCGCIPPFSFAPELTPVVDPALLDHDEIFLSAARLDLSLAVRTPDYLALARPETAAIARPATRIGVSA
ncbi:YbaK/EbsC family protein [Streptomyces sp. JJ36]|uniref:YbaK/EbsC family protein n=1 Tax=Streptomyces sp. JJ36 TaxID=2736645 RepID=UPI001F428A56|nr:YbaK/EbsC family protein [Streptomyces sp. JJ36]MCF6524106.1 YbaK/prolyl-tRNA synthetase associated domain-containing protein [Streptomyces sp. JJ36]